MNTDISPLAFEKQAAEDAEAEKREEFRRHCQNNDKIKMSVGKKPGGSMMLVCALLGFFGGFFACVAAIDSGPSATDTQAWTSQLNGLGTWAGIIFIMSLLGMFLDDRANKLHQKKVKESEALQGEENKRYQQAIAAIDEEAARKAAAYTAEFEKNARAMSPRFAGHRIAQELAAKLSEKFISAIRNCPRGNTDREFRTRCSVNVYKDKIRSDLGYISFYANRCRDLASAQEQAALGIAILSMVQRNVMMAMPLHEGDVSPSVKISSTYTEENTAQCVTVTLTYTAGNRGFVSLQDW